MSGQGAPEFVPQDMQMHVAVIVGSWHSEYVDQMRKQACNALEATGSTYEILQVSGAFEMPLVAQRAADAEFYDAVICLGVVMRGSTPHFDYVCKAVTDGLMQVQLDTNKPVGFGVLTVDTPEQAYARAGFADSPESKGKETVEAVMRSFGLIINMELDRLDYLAKNGLLPDDLNEYLERGDDAA